MSSTSSIFQRDINTYLLFRQHDFSAHQQTYIPGKGCFNSPRNGVPGLSVTNIIVGLTVELRQLDLFLAPSVLQKKPFQLVVKLLQLTKK